MSRLLTVEEAAERLRISKYTLYNWLQKEKNSITNYAFKIGERRWVSDEEDLEEFIKSQKMRSLERVGGEQ